MLGLARDATKWLPAPVFIVTEFPLDSRGVTGAVQSTLILYAADLV